MTAAVLTRTLDDELSALLRGEASGCLVCGEDVELARGQVLCPACGSTVSAEGAPDPGQLALV